MVRVPGWRVAQGFNSKDVEPSSYTFRRKTKLEREKEIKKDHESREQEAVNKKKEKRKRQIEALKNNFSIQKPFQISDSPAYFTFFKFLQEILLCGTPLCIHKESVVVSAFAVCLSIFPPAHLE